MKSSLNRPSLEHIRLARREQFAAKGNPVAVERREYRSGTLVRPFRHPDRYPGRHRHALHVHLVGDVSLFVRLFLYARCRSVYRNATDTVRTGHGNIER